MTYSGAAFGASAIAFGGLSWALDGAAAPVVAVERLELEMASAGALSRAGSRDGRGATSSTSEAGAPEIRFRDVTFTYPTGGRPVLDHFDLTIPAGASLAIVGQNGAGKTTIAKLLCRLYDPDSGTIEIDGVDLRDLDLAAWRAQLAAVFQDFVRYELTAARQRRTPRRDDGRRHPRARPGGCPRPGRPRHPAGQGLPRRHRPLRRAVATRRPRPGDRQGRHRGERRTARRADRDARRPGRVRDLPPGARRDVRGAPRSWSPTGSRPCARPS